MQYGVEQAINSLMGYGGYEVDLVCVRRFAESFVEVVAQDGYVGQVELVDSEDLGLETEVFGVLGEFGVYLAILGDGIIKGAVHEMYEDAGPLDVPEEFMPESDALVGALDEAGDVNHDECLASVLDHAERGFEGGEGVVGNPGPGGRHDGQKAGLSGVRGADYSDVREQLEFETQSKFFARLSGLGKEREAVGGSGVVVVSGSTASSGGGEEQLSGLIEVNEKPRG